MDHHFLSKLSPDNYSVIHESLIANPNLIKRHMKKRAFNKFFRSLEIEQILKLISKNKDILLVLPHRFKIDLHFLKASLHCNPKVAYYIFDIESNFLIEKSKFSIEKFKLSDAEKIILLSKNGMLLKYLERKDRLNIPFIISALSHDPTASRFVIGSIHDSIWYDVFALNPNAISYIPPDMINLMVISCFYDINRWNKVSSSGRVVSKFIDIIFIMRDSNDFYYTYFFKYDRVIVNKDLVLKILSRLTSSSEDKKMVLEITRKLSSTLKADKEIMMEIVTRNGMSLGYADFKIKKNVAIAMVAIEENVDAEKYIRC